MIPQPLVAVRRHVRAERRILILIEPRSVTSYEYNLKEKRDKMTFKKEGSQSRADRSGLFAT